MSDMFMPSSFHCPGPSMPSPITSIYESLDHGAFTGERLSAKELKDLISESGAPYQEETKEAGISWDDMPRTARTNHDPLGLSFSHRPEIAYWCPIEILWIQGAPKAIQYNDIALLSGSAGHKLICRCCNHQIGTLVEMRS